MIAQSEANIQGLTACYYSSAPYNRIYEETWFYNNNAESCSLLETLDLEDYYKIDQEHIWPGLDDRIEETFSASITGYLNIGVTADYTFFITTDKAVSLFFDDLTEPLISFSVSIETVKNGTINLTSGRHLIRLYFGTYSGSARLLVQYSSPAAGLPLTTIDKTVTFVGGMAPSFLEENDIYALISGMIDTTRPRLRGSYVTSYTVSPSLPTGMSINSVSGVISGSSSTSSSGDYTVTATGPLGVATKTIDVTVDGVPLSGLSAKYHKLSGDPCKTQSFPSSLTPTVQTVDENIYHSELPWSFAWPNIPGDIFNSFYVLWKGYIRVDKSGEYQFKLNNRDGARLLINNKNVIENWGCFTKMTEKEGSIFFNQAGYYPIEVQYFAYTNAFGVILMWKTPSDEEYVQIPASKLGHIPEASFTYTTQRTHYYRYVNILGNTPVFFRVNMPDAVFTSDPELPAGLMIQPSGMITGSPSEDSPKTTYTMTATSGSTVLTTTIVLEVSYVEPPTNMTIKDASGKEVTELTFQQFKMSDRIFLKAANHPRNWKFEPELPDKIIFINQWSLINGIPISPLPRTKYTITAWNDGGSVSKSVYITITGCEYGKFIYSTAVDKLSGILVISKNNETLYEQIYVESKQYSIAFCLPQDTYDYSLVCKLRTNETCTLNLEREDGATFLNVNVRGGQTLTGILKTNVTEKPKFIVSEPSLKLSVREQFDMELKIEGVFLPLTITPSLPSGVTLSSNRIQGAFQKQGTFKFTVTTSNEKGKDQVVIEFNIGTCPDNQSLITLSRSYGQSGESMIIYSMDGKEILSVAFEDAPYSWTKCLANAEYRVVMNTTSSSGVWNVGQELLISDSWDDVLASLSLTDGTGKQTEYFTINYAILDNLPMHYYSSSKVNKKWNTLGFKDSKWPMAASGGFGNFTTNTVYFRRKFIVDNKNKYPIFAFDLKIMDGIVAYINGEEVVRRNMPMGEVTESTLAISRYDSLIWRRTSVPTSMLKNGENVLAVELHRYESAPDTGIYFDMYASLLSGTCMLRTDHGEASDSEHTPNYRFPPSAAFDYHSDTYWRDRSLPVFLQFTYHYDRFEYINKIVLQATQDYTQSHPKRFEILGMTDKENGDVLTTVDDRNLFKRKYGKAEIVFTNKKSYNTYRLKIEETNDNSNSAVIGEVALYTCNIVYCPKEKGWESIMIGETTYGSCSRNTFGESTRRCVLNVYDPEWEKIDTTNCLSIYPGFSSAYIDFKFMVSNCTMTNYETYVDSRFINVVTNTLLLQNDSINVFLKRDCSDSETVNVCFNVRLTIDANIADHMYAQTVSLQQEISYLMYQDAPKDFPEGMYFMMTINPILRKPFSKTTVAIAAVLVVAVIVTLSVFLYLQRTKKQNKQVYGGTVSRKATKESVKERMERNKKEKKGLLKGDEE